MTERTNLVKLVASLLLALLPVLDQEGISIHSDLQLGTDERSHVLHHTSVIALGLAVLVLPRAEDVFPPLARKLEWQADILAHGLFELRCVLLDDGEAGVDFGEGSITKLIGAGKIGREVGVGRLEVGMKRCDEGVVGVMHKGERFCAVGV